MRCKSNFKEKGQQPRAREDPWGKEEQEALTGQTRRGGPSATALMLSLCPVPGHCRAQAQLRPPGIRWRVRRCIPSQCEEV